MLPLHIAAGLLGLAAGTAALLSRKGGARHRRSGLIFVCTMLFMAASGAVLAAQKGQRISVVAGTLTFYLVGTALLTVRRPAQGLRWLDWGALLLALAAGSAGIALGFEAAASPGGTIDGLPPPPAFIFGAVGVLAAAGDLRLILGRRLEAAQRLARHLWRMCFALFVAAGSFFLGQAQVFPKPLRSSGLLAVPVLAVLGLMFYWLARLRRGSARPHASWGVRNAT
jgi:hypothetical protein